MTPFDDLCEKVREVLLREWDPIGIRDVPNARDEYDQYVVPIANKVNARNTTSTIVKLLLEIEVDIMGLKGDDGRARRVAERLRGLNDLSRQSF
jgi:predicted polyphosphate/ATP-dependent NAD kinase